MHAERDIVTANPSVCLSVCPPHSGNDECLTTGFIWH